MFGIPMWEISLVVFVTWFIVSWFNAVDPDEVALRSWFGMLGNWIVRPGICFVPWFPGIKLIRIPTKLFVFLFSERDGTHFEVRSKGQEKDGKHLQPIKLNVDTGFFLRFSYKDSKYLKLMIQSEVPFNDEDALKEWVRIAIAPHIMTIFGRKYYKSVMGGQANARLNKEVNDRLRQFDGILRKSGVFGEDPENEAPGTGEARLAIQFVHLPKDLSAKINEAETAKASIDEARNIAARDGELIGGKIRNIVASQYGMKPEDVTVNDRRKFKDDFKYGQKQTTYDRSESVTFSNDNDSVNIDINTAGKEMNDSGLAALIAAGTAFFSQVGMVGQGRRRRTKSGKDKGGGPIAGFSGGNDPQASGGESFYDFHYRQFGELHPQDPRRKE